MRVAVDPDRCQGHNRCHALAPALFDIDDYGYATAASTDVISTRGRAGRPPRGGQLPRTRHQHRTLTRSRPWTEHP